MQAPLKEIRNELKELNPAELAEISLRLARYKKENKELINYLLFYADDPDRYAAEVKEELEQDFANLSRYDYHAVKNLRKILRQVTRHARFTASKQVEADLLLWFCRNFLTHSNTSSSHKPLRTLFLRQLIKVNKLARELPEDLQHDMLDELESVVHRGETSLKGFRRKDAGL
jgi:hypothetical protein